MSPLLRTYSVSRISQFTGRILRQPPLGYADRSVVSPRLDEPQRGGPLDGRSTRADLQFHVGVPQMGLHGVE